MNLFRSLEKISPIILMKTIFVVKKKETDKDPHSKEKHTLFVGHNKGLSLYKASFIKRFKVERFFNY